jgi:ABC-2 type transport system ATP-binding protein
VLIVAKGRLVIESPLAQLTSRVGGSVRVRSPQSSVLEEALRREGLEVSTSNDHALIVSGAPIERVGEIAASASVVLHELVTTGASLEEIFLELTSSDDEPPAPAVDAS